MTADHVAQCRDAFLELRKGRVAVRPTSSKNVKLIHFVLLYILYPVSTSLYHLQMAKDSGAKAARAADIVSREYTVNLHKRIHRISFKKRAPRAIQEIKKFAKKMMRTNDVRISTDLNKAVWAKGVRNVPYRVRVQLHRKRNEDEEAKEKLYTLVTYVPVTSFKNLQTRNVEDDEE